MNLIDGSSVWVQSVAQTLSLLPGVEVVLLLRAPEQRDLLTGPLRSLPRVQLVDPTELGYEKPLVAEQAVDALERLDRDHAFDLVFLRGAPVSAEAARRSAFAGRLWTYFLPPHHTRPGENVDQARLIASASTRVLCQTEPIRALAAAAAPDDAEKLALLPPMIPPFRTPAKQRRDGPLKLFYTGKFAPEYYFLEMVETFRRLRRSLPDAEFHLVGDKVHNPPDDPGFKPAAEAALTGTQNLIWHGGVGRERIGKLLREADVAFSVRHPMMDKELATKVLEYGAAGCAVLLNRTPLYRELLGADYPLFATDPGEVLALLLQVARDPEVREQAAERCTAAARRYTFDRTAEALAPLIAEARGTASVAPA